MEGFKLFNVKDGGLYTLYVDAKEPRPIGVWLEASEGKRMPSGKVKASSGELCFRPGWHVCEYPVATHIGAKENPTDARPSYRPDNQVWALVEFSDKVDYQVQAELAGKCARDKMLKYVPKNGFYRYKTNSQAVIQWYICGSIKIKRILTDEEVESINNAVGLHDLPRKGVR